MRPSHGWAGPVTQPEQPLKGGTSTGWILGGPLPPEGPVLRYRARLHREGKPEKKGVVRIVTEPALYAEMEARTGALAGLRHASLVAVLDHGRYRGRPFRLDAELDAPTVRDWARSQGPMRWGAVSSVAGELVSLLEALHAAGLVHGHVCPDTVRLVRSGDRLLPILTDTPALAAGLWQPFAAPELRQDNRPDARADVFGLGLVLHGLLNGEASTAEPGRSPWGEGRPGPAVTLDEAVTLDPPLRELLSAMVDRYASRRPDSVSALRALAGPSGATGTPTPPVLARRPPSTALWFALLGLLALLTLIGGLWATRG